MNRSLTSRHVASWIGATITGLCAMVGAIILIVILAYVAYAGAKAINPAFLTQLPVPVGETGGGVANGIVGTLITVAIATLLALPMGLLGALFLALFGRGWFPEAVRLDAMPSPLPLPKLNPGFNAPPLRFAWSMFTLPFTLRFC